MNRQLQPGGVDRYRFTVRQGQPLTARVSARELLPYLADAVPGWMQATLTLGVPAATLEHLDRALAQFEAFCTVTQSIAVAIPVTVRVFDAQGAQLK